MEAGKMPWVSPWGWAGEQNRKSWKGQNREAKVQKRTDISHPGTNQARPCLASEIRQDQARSGWYGHRQEMTSQHYSANDNKECHVDCACLWTLGGDYLEWEERGASLISPGKVRRQWERAKMTVFLVQEGSESVFCCSDWISWTE